MQIDDIYREVAPKLQSYLTGNGCSYATACDIVQETFLRLWKRRDTLSGDLHQVSGLAFTIARNYRNDLARKARHETLGGEDSIEGDEIGAEGAQEEARPGEAEEENALLRKRLKSSLERMPVQLLEIFALSRLSKLTVKDIASGTGVSEANVKVRVHRAKEIFKACFVARTGAIEENGRPAEMKFAILKAMMMLAAVDGEISKEELALYHKLAEGIRGKDEEGFEDLWERSVRAMAYIGFLTEMLTPEEMVREYVREAGEIPRRFVVVLEKMAAVDGDYSKVERGCITALLKGEG